jgi:endoglucanase
MKKNIFQYGVNLGGWISQYRAFDQNHFDTFISESDIKQIAAWGLDHVRLPVDYPVLESDDAPGVYRAAGFEILDRCLGWCRAHGLRLILDLHRAPGYSFTNTLESEKTEENTLFTNPAMQGRFIALWEEITRRYLGQAEDELAFELLNEMALPDSAPWNALAQKTIDRIRAIDPKRLIIVGGNNYNTVGELQNIHLQPDENLLYTFHFYEPMLVTHQKADWVEGMPEYNTLVDYPGIAPGLAEFLGAYPIHKAKYGQFVDVHMDQNLLREMLKPAIEFITQTGNSLYCGEFGVIDQAPILTCINWTRDFIELLREFGIGYGYWSYKEMDFGLVDKNGMIISQELIDIISGD